MNSLGRLAVWFLMQAMQRDLGVTAWLSQASLVMWRLHTIGVERLPRHAVAGGRLVAAPAAPARRQVMVDDAYLARRFLDGIGPMILGGAGPPAA